MSNSKFTASQKSAVTTRDTDLLVCASAGAGKTTVMIERIASMIESGEVTPDGILVLTFTKESARDMKLRLMRRLGDKFDMSTTSIGTFHKFCSDLVQTYFTQIAVNPAFAILDDGTATVLQDEILDEIIESKYVECSDAIDAFCTGSSVQNLKSIILSISGFLNSRADGETWLAENALNGYNNSNLEKNIAMQGILQHYKQAGEYFCTKFTPPNDCFDWALRLSKIKDYDDLHNIALEFSRLKPMKKESPEYVAKEMLNKLLKKIREQYVLPKAQMVKNQDEDRNLVSQVIILVQEYMAQYSYAKKQRNFLDFTDLERYAIEILDDAETLERVRDKYKFIFVDEYQDTNPVQEHLVSLISGSQNVFVVGDVKQSIYGFRGTEVTIFNDRMKSYSNGEADGKVVSLNANFRSNPSILSYVNNVFNSIMRESAVGMNYENFEISSNTLCPDETTQQSVVEEIIIEGGKYHTEASAIAQKISELVATHNVSFNDIAILARNRTHFNVLINVLRQAGIPCITDASEEASNIYEIAMLNNVLYAAYMPTYELPVSLTMQNFIFGFSADDMAQIKLCKVSKELQNRIDAFKAFQQKYHELCKQKCVVDVLTIFMAEYNVINKLLITPSGEQRVHNIYNFLNKLRNSSFSNTVAQYLYMLEHELLDIKMQTSHGGEQCVRIMTIHSSKGLEFENVFLYDTGSPFSSAEKRKSLLVDKTCGMCVYSTDQDEYVKHQSIARLGAVILSDRAQIAEEMRLLYVALTRAKKRLYIVGSFSEGKGQWDTQRNLHDFEILASRSYLDFIRPQETIKADEIEIVENISTQKVLAFKPDEQLVQNLRQVFDKEYDYQSATQTVQKSSVTKLTKGEEVINVDRYTGAEAGTKFHREVQYGELPEAVKQLVTGMTVYKELMFLQNVEQNGEPVLVQGIIDLMATDGKRALIVDYKTTNASPKKLVEYYKPQLDMYADAVKQALGLNSVEKYIYSTRSQSCHYL